MRNTTEWNIIGARLDRDVYYKKTKEIKKIEETVDCDFCCLISVDVVNVL